MYGTFIIAWCVWNWDFLYITFFVDQDLIMEKYGLLKIEYLDCFYSWFSFSTWRDFLILPLFSVCAILWKPLPWLDYFFDNKHGEHVKRKKKDALKRQMELEKEEKDLLGAQKEKLETKKEVEEIKQNLTDEDKWNSELTYLINNNESLDIAMKQMKESIYNHQGRLHLSNMPKEVLTYLDLNAFIRFKDGDTNVIEMTPKGRFFLKNYIEYKERG